MSYKNAKMLAERRSYLDTATAVRDAAKSENRDITDSELAEIQENLDKAGRLGLRIESGQLDADYEREGMSPLDRRIADAAVWEKQVPDRNRRTSYSELASGNPGISVERSYSTDGHGRDKSYSGMFGSPHGDDGFHRFGDFLAVVSSGRFHDRLRPANFASAMTGSGGSSGGFLVPEEFAAMMLDKSLESEIVRPRATVHPMSTDTLKIAGFDSLDNSSNLFGGMIAGWTEEAGTRTETNPTVRKIELKSKKLFILSQASNELVADGKDFETLIGEAMIKAVGWFLDFACLQGTGSGQPLGTLRDPALVTVVKESSQAANTILYQNVVKMLSRLHPACYSTAVWVASPSTIPQLLSMTIPVKNMSGTENVGGSHYAVLTESNGQYHIMGRPALFTEKLPALGNVGDILLADFSQYSIGLRKEIAVEKSIHPGFTSDTSYYRCILRADGQGRWSSPLTPKNGDTLSWCVTLAERA